MGCTSLDEKTSLMLSDRAPPRVWAEQENLPSDAEFEELLRRWIVGFHGDVKPMSSESIAGRVKSYVKQEDLYRETVRFLLAHLPCRPHAVLDLGSSAGGLSVALTREGLQVDGIEPSAAGVAASKARATRLGFNDIRFRQGVGEQLPYEDAHFDLVASLAVLEHVQDVGRVVSETFRVLKPGGFAYFEVPNNIYPFEAHYKFVFLPMMPKRLAKLYVKARGAHPEFLDTVNYMNRFIVRREFARAGFVEIKDLYGEFLSGKASGASWASSGGRLRRLHWAAPALRMLCGPLPTALVINRAVFLLARKPQAEGCT